MQELRLYTSGWSDYELIDAGGGKKLERWGDVVTIRPEVQAYFRSGLPFSEWTKVAHWEFKEINSKKGEWHKLRSDAPLNWTISYGDLNFNLHLTQFKHLGIFPEQRINWDLISTCVKPGNTALNLFAYTGAVSCMAKLQQGDVVHVDSVKQLISWAAENMRSSQLSGIRWVHDDALKFVGRAKKRGEMFDLIIMDPPAWGIGAKNEKWKLEDKLEELFDFVSAILSKQGVLIMNTYSPSVGIEDVLACASKYLKSRKVEVNELWMRSTSGKELYYGILLRSFPS